MQIDQDKLKQLEDDLVQSVQARVEKKLFRSYIVMGGFVVTVLGFFGWNIVSGIETAATNTAKTAAQTAAAPVIEDFKQTLANTQAELTKTQTEAETAIKDVNVAAEKAQARFEVIDDYLERREDIMVGVQQNTTEQLAKWRNARAEIDGYESEMQGFRASIDGFKDTIAAVEREFDSLAGAGNVQQLARDLLVVTQSLEDMDAQLADLSRQLAGTVNLSQDGINKDRLASVVANASQEAGLSRDGADLIGETTVYIQYVNFEALEILDLFGRLEVAGFNLPPAERTEVAEGKREIRYFFDEDRKRAEQLSAALAPVLSRLGYDAEIQPRDFVSFAGRKPRAGTLELWLDPKAL